LNLAILNKELTKYKEAIEIANEGILYNPDISVLYYNRAIFLVDFTVLREYDEFNEIIV